MSTAVTELAGSARDHGRTWRHATRTLQTRDYECGERGRWRPVLMVLTARNLVGQS